MVGQLYSRRVDSTARVLALVGCALLLGCEGGDLSGEENSELEQSQSETEEEEAGGAGESTDEGGDDAVRDDEPADLECEDLRNTGGDCVDEIESDLTLSTVELFDSHGHVMPTWADNVVPVAAAEAGLVGYVVLGLDNTLFLQNANAAFYANCAWIDPDDEDLDGLRETLDNGARCIGELSLRHFPAGITTEPTCHDASNEFLTAVFEEARDRQIPVNVHFDYTSDLIHEFKAALDAATDTTFIWSHMGDAPPGVVADMLTDHDNLYVDISSRNPLCLYNPRFVTADEQRLDDGTFRLKPAWKSVFESFSDRVLFGTDIGPGQRHTQISKVVKYYRIILGQLDIETQEKIGHANGQALFGF